MPRASSASSLSSLPRADRRARSRPRAPAARSTDATGWSVVRRALVEQAYVGLVLEPRAHFRTRRDLPIPGSPDSRTTCPRRPWPAATGAAAARSPRHGRPAASGPPSAAPRSALRPGPRPRPARRHRLGKPLRRRGPRSSSSNRPPSSRRVAWLITTLPGAASACRRAARFGVSPTTASSRAAPFANQLADHDQTGRDADPRCQRRPQASSSLRPAPSAIASPALTARSASSSCASGQPK